MRIFGSWTTLILKAVFGVGVFTLANIGVYYSSGYFQREREYQQEIERFFSQKHVHAVFIGDSHVAELEGPFLAPEAYVLAHGGDSLREGYAKLRYVLSKPNEVDTLFLTVDVHMFGTGRLRSSNGAFVDTYLLRTNSPYGLPHGRPAAAMNVVPLFNDDFVQYLKKSIAIAVKGGADRGPGESEADWQALSEQERIRIARETGDGVHEGIGGSQEPFLWCARIADLARAHGIRIVAIRYPGHPDYFATVSVHDQQVVDSGLRTLGIWPVLDFTRALSEAIYFQDPDHVSKRGALALLQLIGERTGRPLLRADFEKAQAE